MYYAGIGSRQTPQEVLNVFYRISQYLAKEGWVLRSGGADGADSWFEAGCDKENGKKEIYLPWRNFNGNTSPLYYDSYQIQQQTFEIASKFHPAWDHCSDSTKKMHARNVHQMLGKKLDEPTDLVICWTPNGSGSGGTGEALRIAKHYNIKIFDAGSYSELKQFRRELYNYLQLIDQLNIEI